MTITELLHLVLRDADVIGEGQTATGVTITDALETLNQMLATWQMENAFIYAQQVTTFTPTGALSYTVGTGADVSMTRPERVDAVYWRSGTIDYPVAMLDTFEQYESIGQKTQAGEPMYAFYLPSITTGTLYLYPQPSNGTVRLITNATLPLQAALVDTITLPYQYVLPLRTNLYVLIAGMYGAPVKPALAQTAANSLRALKRNNTRIEPLYMPWGIPMRRRGDILSGEL